MTSTCGGILAPKALGARITPNLVPACAGCIAAVPSARRCLTGVGPRGKQVQAVPAFSVTLFLLLKPAPVSFRCAVNRAVGSILFPRGDAEEQITQPERISCFHKMLLHKPYLHYQRLSKLSNQGKSSAYLFSCKTRRSPTLGPGAEVLC